MPFTSFNFSSKVGPIQVCMHIITRAIAIVLMRWFGRTLEMNYNICTTLFILIELLGHLFIVQFSYIGIE